MDKGVWLHEKDKPFGGDSLWPVCSYLDGQSCSGSGVPNIYLLYPFVYPECLLRDHMDGGLCAKSETIPCPERRNISCFPIKYDSRLLLGGGCYFRHVGAKCGYFVK